MLGGHDALLAVRRAVRDLVDCPAAVCSLCVLLRSKGEHPPPGYRVIRKDLNRGKFGDVVELAYQVGGALSTCRLPFRSMILDRYPEQDSAMFPFPGDQLPMFVYPKGMLLEQRSGRDTPKSSFFSFVFTNVEARRTYTACLTFYEPMRPSAARRLTRKLFTCRPDSSRSAGVIGPEQATQGRMRIALHGSMPGGGLGSLSQHSGPRSRSGTGTWSGLGRTDPTAWPRAFARGGGSGAPAMKSASWTKLSAVTHATRYSSTHEQSPAQRSAADIFSSTVATDASNEQDKYPSPLRPPYTGGNDSERNGFPVDGLQWKGEIPLRQSTGLRKQDELRAGEEKVDTSTSIPPTPSVAESVVQGEDGTSKFSKAESSESPVHEWGAAEDSLESELADAEYDRVCRSEDRPCIFAPKTICVISRFPIYGVLRRFLRHLYAISLSRSGVPLERYISMFVACVPMPPPGGCPFHVYLERLENQDPRRSRLKPLTLQMPPEAWLPLMDIDFTAPFRCLSVQSVLTVFALMLQEAKILFLSSRAELLTQVMEALRSLLFPMEWQSVYVPQLPYALAGYLECPGGFMIGMRLSKGELEQGTGGTATVVRDLDLEGVANAVNLDAGEVLLYSGQLADTTTRPALSENEAARTRHWLARGHSRLDTSDSWTRKRKPKNSKSVGLGLGIFSCKRRNGQDGAGQTEGSNSFIRDEETATPWLPEPLYGGLASRLSRELFGKAAVRMGVEEDLDQYESAFEFAPAPDRTDAFSSNGYGLKQRMHFSSERIPPVADLIGVAGDPRPKRHLGGSNTAVSSVEIDSTLVVRDCFLCCMAELLGGICGSVRQSDAKRPRYNLRTKPIDELFNMTEYLASMSQDARPFLQRLTSTQMFWVMVQQWLGSSTADSQLLFFEECAVAMKNRRAGAVVPCRDKEATGQTEGGRSRHDDYIPLVDEVRLKRPDLYGLNSHNLYGSLQFDGSRSTPLATPLTTTRHNSWDVNARVVSSTASRASTGTFIEEQRDMSCMLSSPTFGGQRVAEGKDSGAAGSGDAADPESSPPSARQLLAPFPQKSQVKPIPGQPLGALLRTVHGGDAVRPNGNEEVDLCKICTGPPVIIPGPTVEGLPDEGQKPSFRYDDGWPTPLNRYLLYTSPDALPPIVLKLQLHASLQSKKRVDSDERFTSAATPQADTPWVRRISSSENSVTNEHNRPKLLDRVTPEGDGTQLKPGYRGDKRFWRPHGRGRMVYPDARVYEGEWRQGHHHGEGSMQYGAGNQYSGQWTLGKKNGSGKMTYPDGARYDGSWVDDQRHGQGTYVYASRAVYEGGWEEGRMHGRGCYTSASGSRYEGAYRHGQRSGHGSMSYSGGQTYVGEWADGVRSGFGTYALPDGTKFEGCFKHDLKHGPGTLRRGDGDVRSQSWEYGNLISNVV